MGLPVTVSKVLTAASANAIALAQAPGAAANLTLNGAAVSGGVATLDTQRRVIITSVADETGKTFTIFGTNQYGNAIQESFAGANAGVAVSTKDYLTVTRVAVSAATAGNVTVGTNGVGSTPWIGLNPHVAPANTSIGVVVVGTINYTVEYTYDNDPFGMVNATPATPQSVAWPLTVLAAKTATADGGLTGPATALRLTVNSGAGSASMTVLAAGIVGG